MLTFEEWRHTYADVFETDDAARAAWTAASNKGYSAGVQDTRELLAAHSSGAQEPVAWLTPGNDLYLENPGYDDWTPLYAHPQPMPQAQPVYDKSVVRRLATQWGMIPETAAARDALAEIITARKAMMKRIDDVHTADRQTGCNTFYDNDLERHTAILFRAIDAEIERLDRAKGE